MSSRAPLHPAARGLHAPQPWDEWRDPYLDWLQAALQAWGDGGRPAAAAVLAAAPTPMPIEGEGFAAERGSSQPSTRYGKGDPTRGASRPPSADGVKRRLLGDALSRGGYRCAYCSRRLLDPLVVGLFAAGFRGTGLFPTHWEWKRTHPVVLPRFPALEHVWPLKRGGDPINPGNLVASCWQCNVTKSSSFVEELTDWDGPVVSREHDRFDGLVPLALAVADTDPDLIAGSARSLPGAGEVAEPRPWPPPAAILLWLEYHRHGGKKASG